MTEPNNGSQVSDGKTETKKTVLESERDKFHATQDLNGSIKLLFIAAVLFYISFILGYNYLHAWYFVPAGFFIAVSGFIVLINAVRLFVSYKCSIIKYRAHINQEIRLKQYSVMPMD
jgi:hypothetical protein